MTDERRSDLRRIERQVEEQLRRLGDAGELRGDGTPLPPDEGGPADTWAARHIMRNANATPAWAELREDIDERVSRLRRRVVAHNEWLRDRTRLLSEVPADRIVATAHATAERDRRVRDEIEVTLRELNALIRRYDLLVIPAMQIPLVTPERLGLD